MKFLDRAGGWLGFERKAAAPSTEDILRSIYVDPYRSRSGIAIGWRTALQVTTALACSRSIANGLAQVPFRLHRREGKSRAEVSAKDHPLAKVLRRPNEWQSSFEFRQTIGLHLALTNNAFVFVNKVRGEIAELLPLEPGNVTVRRDGWNIRYELRDDKGAVSQIPASSMWHLRNLAWDSVMGLEAVKLAREALGLALATEEHGARFFGDGAKPPGVLSTEGKLEQPQIEAIRDAWKSAYGGLANSQKVAVLQGGLKFQPITGDNDSAQFLETRRMQIEETCRAFGVMPIMVGHADKTATYASAEQMFLAHVVFTMSPWYAAVEQSADLALLGEDAVDEGYYTKFATQGLLRGDAKTRSEFYRGAVFAGWMTRNEVRALEEMDPLDGLDEPLTPTNMGVGADPAKPDPDPAKPKT
ncbi:MAG: phage portal protein [Alphaproteobacteria bacterium]|nr:phage portal protein [Alphaproteobacteria bacterium]